ncbi:MAG: hypothetical protein WC372_10020 [Candidatus Neomarinimicrobiota bacterium]|jgi:hypothetical protein
MYCKIEPTGCCERKGLVQIRLCFYLDKDDYGYGKHHIQVPDFTDAKYEGKVDELGNPVDMDAYKKWVDSLPKIWQNNPFHNHFIYVDPDTSELEIFDLAEAYLHEAYIKWATDTMIDCRNYNTFPVNVNPVLKLACENKAAIVKNINTEVRI